jgi:hypothetical protein
MSDGRVLIERVEDCAELRIGGRDFHDRTVLHPADVDIVVEVNRARRPRRDAIELQAGFREDEPLRRDRNLQRAENRREIAAGGVELQRDAPGVDLALKVRHRIRRSSRRIRNRRVVGQRWHLRRGEAAERHDAGEREKA